MAMMSSARSSVALTIALLSTPLACVGDDTGSATQGSTSTSTSTSTSEATTGATETTAATAASSGSSEATTSEGSETAATTQTTEVTETTATTGSDGPPDYPPPSDEDTCPFGTASVDLGGGAIFCAPFCSGEGGACPQEALAEATGECSPFFQGGGSGQACGGGEACPGAEQCNFGSCQAVAFWGCLVLCGPVGECPEPMICTPSLRCAYP